MSRRTEKEPTRFIKPHPSADLPAYGPEVPGCKPHLAPSIYCSWCGSETNPVRDIKVCPACDVAPPYPANTKD